MRARPYPYPYPLPIPSPFPLPIPLPYPPRPPSPSTVPVATIPARGIDRSRTGAHEPPLHPLDRECRSIIMTDYSGFSRLNEMARPLFLDQVMGRVARTTIA